MNGIYFYKLQSPYPNDVTKNCKLTINEIDSNFLFLEDNDIKECTFDRDSKLLVLTKNNGEQLAADLSDVTYNLTVDYDDGCGTGNGGTLTISYDGKDGQETIVVDKLVTTDNLNNVVGHDILTKVVTDDTLHGEGTLDSPLSVNKAYETGSFGPVTNIVDTTKGEHLPTSGAYGEKYLTKELVGDYGYLYNYDGVEVIQDHLQEKAVAGKEDECWHVPSKEEWDALLNSLESCKYQNHQSADVHVELGKDSGRMLKSACGWLEQADCECDGSVPLEYDICTNTSDEVADVEFTGEGDEPVEAPNGYVGTDEIGFTVYPVGIAYNDEYKRPTPRFYKAQSVFWTTTHVNGDPKQDIFVKVFNYNKATVGQETECSAPYYSLRLVKKYNGSNYYGSEVIDGVTYGTILVPEVGQIWLTSNVAYAGQALDGLQKDVNYTAVNNAQSIAGRTVFFINCWNGTTWERKELGNGDTVVVNACNDKLQNNIEYRVYTDSKCNAVLVNTDDLITERVLGEVGGEIDQEKDERVSGDTIINDKLDQEIQDRISGDTEIWETLSGITPEIEELQELLSGLTDDNDDLEEALQEEISARTSGDSAIWEALNNEINERLSGDTQQTNAINTERSEREEADDNLTNAIKAESSGRVQTDKELLDKINNIASGQTNILSGITAETERAQAKEDELNDKLIDSSSPYTLKVTEGVILKSIDGDNTHSIKIQFDGNYGELI